MYHRSFSCAVVLGLFVLAGCESVPPSGDMLSPVPVSGKFADPVPPGAGESAAAHTDDKEWDTREETVPSEVLQGKAPATPESGKKTDLFGNTVSGEPGKLEGAPLPSTSSALATPVKLPTLSDPWPVRLLATLPSAQPPRAILGLASGEEKVVSPGMILADQGLVVMSVADGSIELARVTPAGDHAQIVPVLLTAQYASPTVTAPVSTEKKRAKPE